MIKSFFIFFLLIFLNISVKAYNFTGGVLIGFNTSQVGGDDLGGFNKLGLVVGVFINKPVLDKFSLQMEMNYAQKGSNNPNMNNNTHPNYLKQDISTTYLEVPFLIQYKQNIKTKIEAGIIPAYLINGYYKDINGKIPSQISPFTNFDLELLIGVSYQFNTNLGFSTRLANSVIPISTEDYNQQASFNHLRKGKYNSILTFVLHYII